MDILRKRAGGRRPSRWWDRGLWFCGLGLGVLTAGLGLWAEAASTLGHNVTARVVSCHTGLHVSGRFLDHVTTCNLQIDSGAFTGTHSVEMSARHEPGSTVTLASFRGTLSDSSLVSSRALLIPTSAVLFGATWWMGFPPRKGPDDTRPFRRTRPRGDHRSGRKH